MTGIRYSGLYTEMGSKFMGDDDAGTPQNIAADADHERAGHGAGLGSGLNGQPLCVQPCANPLCPNPSSKICKDCKLVGYCSKDCQRQHWQQHKLLCRCNLMKLNDMGIAASLKTGLGLIGPNPLEECLWGNVPAYGLLGSSSSSSSSSCPSSTGSPSHLQLCFAASGDLRNVIETLSQLPDGLHGRITVHVNDISPKVVVRNYLMLELLRIYGDEAIDAVIALWYSLALTPAQLQATLAVAKRVQDWPVMGDHHHSSSASFGPNSDGHDCLVVKLQKHSLDLLKGLCDNCMPLSQATRSRTRMMEARPELAKSRMGCLRPSHRVAWNHFRQTGVLLPLAIDLRKHKINRANRFLILPRVGWALGDGGSDPLHGWDMREVLAAAPQHGVPSMDMYGCLFFYVRAKLHNFVLKWRQSNATFILTDMAAADLAAELRSRSPIPRFHRIDTSNIADEQYEGVKRVLKGWGPLLAEPSSSPIEPILITYFMNWGNVYNSMKILHSYVDTAGVTAADLRKAQEKAFKRRGMEEMLRGLTLNGELDWYRCYHDFSSTFKEYLQMHGAHKAAEKAGVQQREQHALVPHRLFVDLNAGSHATPAEFFSSLEDLYFTSGLESGLTLVEQFVEWGPSPRKKI